MSNQIIEVFKTLNILCVEDDLNVLEIYKDLFSLMFKKVYFATDGLEGLEHFKNEKIDMVLTDYQMPKCNGLDMSREIRTMDASVPIVMITALESIDMLREALDINITSFLKKPFTSKSLISGFSLSVKSIIADRILMEEQNEKIHYSDYQESLTFNKEKIITKNDLKESKKLLDFQCEVVYKPKDILSGDSYVIRKISDDEYFIFLVDGMGKGISASVTAMMCSAFIDYEVSKLLLSDKPFELKRVVEALLEFINPNLLEDEVISSSFLYFNKSSATLEYALFSMPPVLYTLEESEEVYKLTSNNTPMANYLKNIVTNKISLSKISKLLVYSDGLNENSVSNPAGNYGMYLKEDFYRAKNMNDFENLRIKKIKSEEDDVTYVLLTEVICKEK